MGSNNQEKIRVAGEYFIRADQGAQMSLNSSMKMPKSISLNSDLDLHGTRSLKWLNDFEGSLEYVQHDHDRFTFIPSGDYLVVEGSRSRLQGWSRLAALIGIICLLSDFAPVRSQTGKRSDVPDPGATARQAMIEIFRNRDSTAIDRFFSDQFVQHDPNIADGLSGLRAFVTEVMNSPRTKITIYRTVVDGDIVMLHSKYDSWPGFSRPVIAFDLLRFKNGKIVEHWGGQTPETVPNLSEHTQVDGPTAVVDREWTEANRNLVRNFKQVVTVELRFDRLDEFIDDDHYTQHASKVGDGTTRMRARVSEVEKPGAAPVLIPRRYIAEGNFVLCLVESHTEPPTANYDLFRVENGKIAEHWDVLSAIPLENRWKNTNSPF